MKSWLCIILSLLFSLPIMARRRDSVVTITNGDSLPIVSTDTPQDSFKATKRKSAPKPKSNIYSWNYKGHLATKQNAGIDTSMNEFYVNHPALKKTIAIQSLGNLGLLRNLPSLQTESTKPTSFFFNPTKYTTDQRTKSFISTQNVRFPTSTIIVVGRVTETTED